MALTIVKLQNIYNRPVGTIGCYLIHDSSITGLTYPAKVPILDLGGIKESVDSLGNGKTILDNVTVTLREDYSVYVEGFWHKLLTEYTGMDVNGFPCLLDFELMFTVFEDTDETFVFRGKIYRIECPEEEYYLDSVTSPSAVVRGVKLTLVSSLTSLQNVSIAQLQTEIYSHLELRTLYYDVPAGSGTYLNVYMVSYKIIIASMLKLAMSETYTTSAIINNSTDIQIKGASSAYIDWLNGYVDANYFWTAGSGINTYPSGQMPTPWYDQFSNAYDLLVYICQGYGVVPRLSFGTSVGLIDATPSNNISRIILNSRGRSGGNQVAMTGKLLTPASSSSPIQATFMTDTQNKPRNFSVNCPFFEDGNLLYSYNGLIGKNVIPQNYMSFDLGITVDFLTHAAYQFPTLFLHFVNEYNRYDTVLDVQYWNYKTGAYVIVTGISYISNLAGAVFEYLYNRFTPWRCQFEREYGSLQVNNVTTTSQRNCRTLMRSVINDGVISRNTYASEVEKDLLNNKVRVLWIQE